MQSITKAQMAKLDKVMIEQMGIDVPIMMEHAGLNVAKLAAKLSKNKKILALVGSGNNGGDGLCAVRHLMNWGYSVDIVLATSESKLKKDSSKQLKILKKMKTKIISNGKGKGYGLIIDALLGYNISGNPRGKFRDLIAQANKSKTKTISVDIPSGLDATTGKLFHPHIHADATLSLTMPKTGLMKAPRSVVGNIYVAYMSVPDVVYKKLRIKKPFKGQQEIIKVTS